jgi:hypothetical protein
MPTARPVIGDFRSPPVNPPRTETAAAPDQVEVAVEKAAVTEQDAEAAMLAAAEALKKEADNEAKLSPSEKYAKRLADGKLSLVEARAIFDSVMTDGYYEEVVTLGPVRATLRTRMYEDTLRLQRVLELEKPQLLMSQEELVTRYNLAASLYGWQGKVIAHETEADFEKALKIVRNMPAPIFTLLARELFRFDQKILLAFGDGAVESFS